MTRSSPRPIRSRRRTRGRRTVRPGSDGSSSVTPRWTGRRCPMPDGCSTSTRGGASGSRWRGSSRVGAGRRGLLAEAAAPRAIADALITAEEIRPPGCGTCRRSSMPRSRPTLRQGGPHPDPLCGRTFALDCAVSNAHGTSMTRRRLDLAQRSRGAGQGPPAPGHLAGRYPPDFADRRDQGGRELGTSQAPSARRSRTRGPESWRSSVPWREGQAPDHRGAARGVRGAGEARVPGSPARRPNDDGRGPRRPRSAPRRDAAGCPGGGSARGGGPGRGLPRPPHAPRPKRRPWSGCGRRSSPSRGPTSRWCHRGPTPNGPPTFTRPILLALQARDVEGVEAALRHHFRTASEHLASGGGAAASR